MSKIRLVTFFTVNANRLGDVRSHCNDKSDYWVLENANPFFLLMHVSICKFFTEVVYVPDTTPDHPGVLHHSSGELLMLKRTDPAGYRWEKSIH